MKAQEIIDYVNSKGGLAALKNYFGEETIPVFTGKLAKDPDNGIEGWKHAIFLNEKKGLWSIGFSKSAETKYLEEKELKFVLDSWIKEPSNELLKQYE